jgi:hypothetical protein
MQQKKPESTTFLPTIGQLEKSSHRIASAEYLGFSWPESRLQNDGHMLRPGGRRPRGFLIPAMRPRVKSLAAGPVGAVACRA